MTPFQARSKVAGVQRDRRKWSLHQAWHGEVFARQTKLKEFSEVLGEKRFTPTARKTPREMMATLRAMGEQHRKRAARAARKAARDAPQPKEAPADG